CNRQTAIGAVVGRSEQPLRGERDEQRLEVTLATKIESRRRTAEKAERQLEMLTRAEFAGPAVAKQHDRVAGAFELPAHYAISVLEQPDNTDRRRRKNRTTVSLVVETDVAAGDRHAERTTGGANAFDGARELPHDFRPLRIAEV